MTEAGAKRLGDLVRARRRELKLTQADVQEAGGPSTATLRLIEGGKHTDFRPTTAAPLEQILQWEPGSIDAVLNGKEPAPIGRPMPSSPTVLGMATHLWRCITELAETPDGDPLREAKADLAIIAAADLLVDVLLALNAGPPAKPLIWEMSNKAYELLNLDKEKEDAVEATETAGTSAETVKDEEAGLSDDAKRARVLARLRARLSPEAIPVENPDDRREQR